MRVVIFALSLVVACSPPSAPAFDEANIPLDLSAPRPMVEIAITGGAPAKAIFDTGASGSVVDRQFAEAAGLANEGPVRIGSPAGGDPIEDYLTTIPELKIGEATVAKVHAAVFDLPMIPGQDVVAILTPTFLPGAM
ncbi:MAG: retropepsin-like aspartic protease [Parvularculaceae bacterium]